MDAPGIAPDPAEPTVDSRSWLTLAVCALGVLMVMADTTIVNVALPSIREDLGYLEVSITELQWVVNAYVLSFAVLLLAVGRLSDLFGRRLLFVIGLIVFVAASIACGAAQDIWVLIGFRAVQGAGAALITPTSLSIVTLTFPTAKRGVAIAIWSGIVGVGVGLGPLLGGLLSEYVDWRWVFFINVPIGVFAVFGAFAWVRESKGAVQERRLDVAGLLLSGVGLFSLTFALLKANDFGWGDPRTLVLFAVGGLTSDRVRAGRARAAAAAARPLALPQPHVLGCERNRHLRRLRPLRAAVLRLALHAERDGLLGRRVGSVAAADDGADHGSGAGRSGS